MMKKDITKKNNSKSIRISELLKEYRKCNKKSNGQGRRIRRHLRRLGYRLSEHKSK